MDQLKKVTVVLPSLDPDEKLKAVIDGLLEYGFTDIILVNDGSKPENLHYFEEAAEHPEVHLLHHPVNRGKGAALKTAFTWFLENRPEQLGVVTVDGDNQHHPADTKACALHMVEKEVVTLGVRDFSLPGIPARSRHGNRTTSLVFKIFCGMTISDTQTGLRAIHRKDLETINAVKGDRFEYETNMLLALKENAIDFDEVKIQTVYIEENKSSHFRAVRDSWRIYKLILAHFFKYSLSSVASYVVEIILLGLMLELCSNAGMHEVLAETVSFWTARVLSSVVNFGVNKILVFRSRESIFKAFIKYAMVAAVSGTIQYLADLGLTELLGVGADQSILYLLIHTGIMVIMFIVNYMIQQRWVFRSKKTAKK